MSKNIVIFCDGTGNEISTHLSNVLKLYRITKVSETQCRFYDPGVGTIAEANPWMNRRVRFKTIFGLATGRGLDENILDAYRFLIEQYQQGDKIFLFGFSRGAYCVRALAGLIYQVGILRPAQANLARYALTAYRQVPFLKNKDNAWRFARVTATRRAPIHFMGLWDSVGSVLVPRRDRVLRFTLQNLPYTDHNPGVRTFRQAAAIDEKRRMFRLQQWSSKVGYQPNPFAADPAASRQVQDSKQVWFAGVHSDVGGGYPEDESALAKYPLAWITDEACAHGLEIDQTLYDRLVFGSARVGSSREYRAPDPHGMLHDSMTLKWKPLEYWPKKQKWLEWKQRKVVWKYYLPRQEPRYIEPGAYVHQSAFERRENNWEYKPVNWPESAVQVDYAKDKSKPKLASVSKKVSEIEEITPD